MIVVIARAKIRPEKRDGFLAAASACVETSRAESGNIAYDVYESATETNSFVVLERWKSHEDNRAHLQSAHTQTFLRAMAQSVAEMPRIEAITPAKIDMIA